MKKKSKLQVSMSCLLSAALLTTTPFMTGGAVYGQEMEEEFVSDLEAGTDRSESPSNEKFDEKSDETKTGETKKDEIKQGETITDQTKTNDSKSDSDTGSESDDISISDTQEEPDTDSKNKDAIEEDSNEADLDQRFRF